MIFEIDMKNNATLTEEFVSDLFFIASGGKFKYVLNKIFVNVTKVQLKVANVDCGA